MHIRFAERLIEVQVEAITELIQYAMGIPLRATDLQPLIRGAAAMASTSEES
ncbi:hypothetical protein ACWCW7_35230 [Nocardia tengchongensis]